MTSAGAPEAIFHTALNAMDRFPGQIDTWHALDPGTQATAIVNVIEAMASLGLGIAEQRVAFLLGCASWSLGSQVREWYEPTLLRVRAKNALGLSPDESEVERLRSHMPQFKRLMPYLVSLETVMDPAVLARLPPTPNQNQQVQRDLDRLSRDLPRAGHENRLYYYMLSRKFPVFSFPGAEKVTTDELSRIARSATLSKSPGRVRRLGFTCFCLGALGLRDDLTHVFDHLNGAVHRGACEPGDGFIEDHITPSSLRKHPTMVAAYNASIVLRCAKYVLDESTLSRVREWCRQVARGLSLPPKPSEYAGTEMVLARWQGTHSGSMGYQQITKENSGSILKSLGSSVAVDVPADVAKVLGDLGPVAPDIVVDETGMTVSVEGETSDILEWSGNDGRMLWLVMTRAGGLLKHDDVRQQLGFVPTQRVSQLRYHLGRRIGHRLLDIMLPPGRSRGKAWHVPDRGWTFLWLRPYDPASPERSLLAPK